jgi:hypothetical protein
MGCSRGKNYIKDERKKFVNGEADMAVTVKKQVCVL